MTNAPAATAAPAHIAARLTAPGPKRILALDGGGTRGIITLAFLAEIEATLRRRFHKPDLVLSDYFDLIGGTSVGSMIATLLALGRDVASIRTLFEGWAPRIFDTRDANYGLFDHIFDARVLRGLIQAEVFDKPLRSPEIRTGLVIAFLSPQFRDRWVRARARSGAGPAPRWGAQLPSPLSFQVIKTGGFGRVPLPTGRGREPTRRVSRVLPSRRSKGDRHGERVLGDLSHDLLGDGAGLNQPLLSFARYDVRLENAWLEGAGLIARPYDDGQLAALRDFTNAGAIPELAALASKAAKQQVADDDFPAGFDNALANAQA